MKALRFAFILLLCLGVFLCLGAAAYAEPAVIDPAAFDGVTGLTIIAPGGSTAETFAAAHGFDFMPAA